MADREGIIYLYISDDDKARVPMPGQREERLVEPDMPTGGLYWRIPSTGEDETRTVRLGYTTRVYLLRKLYVPDPEFRAFVLSSDEAATLFVQWLRERGSQ